MKLSRGGHLVMPSLLLLSLLVLLCTSAALADVEADERAGAGANHG